MHTPDRQFLGSQKGYLRKDILGRGIEKFTAKKSLSLNWIRNISRFSFDVRILFKPYFKRFYELHHYFSLFFYYYF